MIEDDSRSKLILDNFIDEIEDYTEKILMFYSIYPNTMKWERYKVMYGIFKFVSILRFERNKEILSNIYHQSFLSTRVQFLKMKFSFPSEIECYQFLIDSLTLENSCINGKIKLSEINFDVLELNYQKLTLKRTYLIFYKQQLQNRLKILDFLYNMQDIEMVENFINKRMTELMIIIDRLNEIINFILNMLKSHSNFYNNKIIVKVV